MAASIVPPMPESRGARLAAGAHQWARIALALLVIGPSIVLVYCWVEVLNHPGISLADGYAIGRTPWTPLGIVVALAGGVAGIAAGNVAIVIEGSWARRLVALAGTVAAAAWWATALGIFPYAGFRGPDPVTLAYSLPVACLLLALAPAALLSILCLTPQMQIVPRPKMRRLASTPRGPRTWLDADEDPESDEGSGQ
jgi:hypothetical protein